MSGADSFSGLMLGKIQIPAIRALGGPLHRRRDRCALRRLFGGGMLALVKSGLLLLR